ncbi:PAS domain-containing protein [Lyngbya sp. CCY1209]|uniref:PAS domain-containing protein n=1 Tax=Lyngbya sp. CCY1209 TaxID=2886103 RepID=UPI002D20E84E|nr:PAS domain-containing protein [Lyngbya sp. CCY1209]MEB3885433.1 PAS domain-containing protein [Lyngbya sp. CCY1209]
MPFLTELKLESVIIRDLLQIAPTTPVGDALRQMAGLAPPRPAPTPASCALVVENGRLLGILTEGDLPALYTTYNDNLDTLPISEVMKPAAVTLRESDCADSTSVITLMQRYGVRHLPLLDDRDRPVGLLTRDRLWQHLHPHSRNGAEPPPPPAEDPRRADNLRRELQLLENILDIILAGYWDWDIPNHREYLSPGFKRMFGYEDHELPNSPDTWQKLIFPEDLPGMFESFDRHVRSRGEIPFYNEVRYRHKDGSTVWVICSGRAIEWDPAGNPLRAIGCHIDITDRKRTEEQLKKSQAHLQAAQRIAKLGSWEFDIATESVFWSEEVFQIFRLDPASGAPTYEEVLQLYHPDDRDYHRRVVATALENRQPYDLECRIPHPDGSLSYIQARGEPVFDDRGRVAQLVGTILDITDRKRAEMKLLQATAQLEASNRELEAFAYSVSHDLRAPLRAIDGFSQAILEDYGDQFDEGCRDYFHRIRRNINRMGQLIDDLLRLSRVSRSPVNYHPVNLSEMVSEIAADLAESEPDRDVEFAVAPDVTVEADPTLMGVVLNNLLHNAWKFTRHTSRARIEFGLGVMEGKLTCFIGDNGAGFDMKYAPMLFGVFQRLHDAEEFPGTGIGLAIVQRAIHRHGGKVWAEGAVGKGATFYFTLPGIETHADGGEKLTIKN